MNDRRTRPRHSPSAAVRASVALRWMRTNLFDGFWNSLLTIVALWLIVEIVPPLVDWALTNAVWVADDPQLCRQATGACWAIIHEKYRLVLFGRYPYPEQWRPLLGMAILVGGVLTSCNRHFWRPWLLWLWVAGLGLFFGLMHGGVLGLRIVPNELWGGLPLTLLLTVVGIAAAFPISILLALGRRSKMPVIRAICVAYIELIRGVPLISLLFIASFMLPLFMPTGVTIDALLRAQVAIVVFTSAYLAEVIRGGLQAIPKGQYEAAEALGLPFWRTQRLIVLPQALRIVIPPIVGTFIGLFKDTSLVAIVSLTDLLLAMRQAVADPNWRAYFVEAYLFIAAIYFFFCFFMSKYSQYLERHFETGHPKRDAESA